MLVYYIVDLADQFCKLQSSVAALGERFSGIGRGHEISENNVYHSPPPPPPPPPLRIQPLSGRISAVTQLHSEAYVQSTLPTPSTQSTSTNTTSEEQPQDTSTAEGGEGSKREDSSQTEGGENVASTAGQTVVPGGCLLAWGSSHPH